MMIGFITLIVLVWEITLNINTMKSVEIKKRVAPL
jgi:hypothetical protein